MTFLQGLLQTVLRLPSAPSPTTRFFDLGMDSLMAVELRTRMNQALAGEYVVPNTAVFDHPDAASLARHLAGELAATADTAEAAPPPEPKPRPAAQVVPRPRRQDDNAVAHRRHGVPLPRRRGPGGLLEAAWRPGEDAVADGRDGTDAWTGLRRGPRRAGRRQPPRRVRRCAGPLRRRVLRPGAHRGAQHGPRSSACCWRRAGEALEDAGVAPGSVGGSRTGVYFGIALSEYRDLMTATGNGGSAFGNCGSIAVGRGRLPAWACKVRQCRWTSPARRRWSRCTRGRRPFGKAKRSWRWAGRL